MDDLYAQALAFYKSGENSKLEKLFAKFLKKSYDVAFWSLYIDYVKKVSTKKVNLVDVYAFVTNHFNGSYVSFEFVRDYISILELSEGDNPRTEDIRRIYHRAFQPMAHLGLLWSDYEKWETRINKQGARSQIEQIHPIFMQASSVYQRLAPYVETNNFFSIFDIEHENPLKLGKEEHEARLMFFFSFYLSKFPNSEALSFLFSFYLRDAARERLDLGTNSPFLRIWYSFQYETPCFDLEDPRNGELMLVNYLNWVAKNEGLEVLVQRFEELKARAGPRAFIYVANSLFFQGRNKEGAYQMFMDGVKRFNDDPLLNEAFFQLFLGAGDDDTIRLLFKKLKTTERMWELMVSYEFQHGEMNDYRELLTQEIVTNREITKGRSEDIKKMHKRSSGSRGAYEAAVESFEFMGLKLTTGDVLSEFISKLPGLSRSENVLIGMDNGKVVDLLTSLANC